MELASPEVLAELERQGQARNQALGITGLLLYLNGSTLHLLEGVKEQVLNEYDLISRDPRHNHITVLYQSPASQRLFSGWHINYKAGSIRRMQQFDALESTPPDVASIMELSILRSFYETNHCN